MSDRERDELVRRYLGVRECTERLAAPLSPEDQQLQSMPACSPTKWHRAHTTWFFETFLLLPRGASPVNASYAHLFNSYYEAVGTRHARPKRGLLSRPSADEIAAYRRAVDGRVVSLLREAESLADLTPIVSLGIAHEEQHQELLLTDILHAFSENPAAPVYREGGVLGLFGGPSPVAPTASGPGVAVKPRAFEGGLVEIGARPGDGFAFDNEGPRHRVFLEPFAIEPRLVNVGELRAFMDDRGYETPSLWLSEGFEFVRGSGTLGPLYVRREGSVLVSFGLAGERALADDEPATFLSYFEADAIARYLGGRLPTEAEWEHAVSRWEGPRPRDLFDPRTARTGPAWEWTQSAYAPYPGFRPIAGALGEYNGKFMSGQMVLRGGSMFTPPSHVRASYRNFWPPATRFQCTGARVARDVT